jgi:hypothetical protein
MLKSTCFLIAAARILTESFLPRKTFASRICCYYLHCRRVFQSLPFHLLLCWHYLLCLFHTLGKNKSIFSKENPQLEQNVSLDWFAAILPRVKFRRHFLFAKRISFDFVWICFARPLSHISAYWKYISAYWEVRNISPFWKTFLRTENIILRTKNIFLRTEKYFCLLRNISAHWKYISPYWEIYLRTENLYLRTEKY